MYIDTYGIHIYKKKIKKSKIITVQQPSLRMHGLHKGAGIVYAVSNKSRAFDSLREKMLASLEKSILIN